MEYRLATYNSSQPIVEVVSMKVSAMELVWVFYITIENFKETSV